MRVSLDVLNTVAQLGTLVVFAATAIAALAQIKQLRASNELDAFLNLSDALRQPELRDAFRYVQTSLPERLEDPAYRAELARLGFIDARTHPEMDACNWFNEVGTLVKHRLVDERTFLDLFARLVTYYWARLEPVVALLRRGRGAGQYENFEYLALLAERWRTKHPDGDFPAHVPRRPLADPWRGIDAER
ncbi:MAG: hypothetical protein NVS3B16_16060 [Vulcanimicrobiaceae bacterium]